MMHSESDRKHIARLEQLDDILDQRPDDLEFRDHEIIDRTTGRVLADMSTWADLPIMLKLIGKDQRAVERAADWQDREVIRKG